EVEVWRGPAAAHRLRRPWRIRPGTLGAALLPPGNVPSDAVAAGVRNLYGNAWPVKPTWICAVRLDDGRLVVFGRAGSPPASIGDAGGGLWPPPASLTPGAVRGPRDRRGRVHSGADAPAP